jgi:dihydropteroate synthase-like protein
VEAHRRVLFVTGKLAEPALRRMLAELAPAFAWEVAVLKITVASLMTTPWIARYLTVPEGTDLIMIPGLCEGDTAAISEKFGVRVTRGPKDLREIPRFFGREVAAADYGGYRIEILAEINNAPKWPRAALMREARRFRDSGADVIDVGCTPGLPFPALGETVRELRASGFRVSIDSLDRLEILAAVEAGAEMVLSVNGSNRDVLADLRGSGTSVVAIPDSGGGLASLASTVAAADLAGIRCLIDPIVEPIGFGFFASLERYGEARRRYPAAPLFMGVGNITELTSADSTGVNALLIAICEELGVAAVLTTEVIPWARGAVREIDIARRLMHHAISRGTLPKGVDDRLVTVKDPAVLAYSEEELREVQRQLTDSNYRIFTDRETVTVFNREQFIRGVEIQEIYDQLGITDPSHAFYLGKELARARLAIALGKTYRQEGQLTWGYLTPPDDPKREHFRPGPRRRPDA